MQVKLKPHVRPDQIPCDPAYFAQFLEGNRLTVIREYSSMVRAVDGAGEEWSLFNGQFNVVTGL